MKSIRIVPLENDIYSVSAVFDYDEVRSSWIFRGACNGDGEIDEIETVTAKRLMDIDIAMALKQLNDEGPPEKPPSTFEDEMVQAASHIDVSENDLRSRMKRYMEDFMMLGTVDIEEFGLRMTVRGVGEGYKAEVHCEDDLKEKIFEKQGSERGNNEMEKIFLECGKDKAKVIPLAIKQAENFSLWIATL
jgi:hypothetical protein